MTLAGALFGSAGTGARSLRVFGRFALVLLVEGQGNYRDARGLKSPVRAGDAILVFPELGHSYGPNPRGTWNEIHVVFDGPIFELWRREGLLDVSRPLHIPLSFSASFAALHALVSEARPPTIEAHLGQLHRFLAILGAILDFGPPSQHHLKGLERAKTVLGANLEKSDVLREAARASGQSYESFRKNFARETGLSPSRFRDLKRLEAAQTLLLRAEMTNAAIARALGFRDEAHFSRRFKELSKQTPRDFRRAASEKLRPGGFEPPTEAL